MQTIYADVLIILNIYVNFFLLRTTAGITHSPLKTSRCIAASAYGSLFSLMILLPPLSATLNLAIKIAAAVTVVIAAFGFQSAKRLIINTSAFLISNIVLAGAVYAVYNWFHADFIHFNNSCFYIDFSLLILILTTAFMYLAVWAAKQLLDRTPSGEYRVIIRCGRKLTSVNGFADTGNVLTDCFTGSSVIICDIESFTCITGNFLDSEKLPAGFRYIYCSTVSESGMIPVFRPDEVLIEDVIDRSRKRVDALIGFGNNCGKAVFNPKLLKI